MVGAFGEIFFKIDLPRRLTPQDRFDELGDSSVPFDFDAHAFIDSDDAPALESKLHKHFLLLPMNKVDHRKEFFRVDLKHIREEIEALGVKTVWTMAAAAKEYFETQAIEKAIEKDPTAREAWGQRQLVPEDTEGPVLDEMEPETVQPDGARSFRTAPGTTRSTVTILHSSRPTRYRSVGGASRLRRVRHSVFCAKP